MCLAHVHWHQVILHCEAPKFQSGDLQQLHRSLILGAFTGEYIAAEKIEAAYKKNEMVEQIWVYGNSFESTLVAIVVPTGKTLCVLVVYNVFHVVSLCMPYQHLCNCGQS